MLLNTLKVSSLVFVLSTVAGCSNNNADEYFPLHPGTTWLYDVEQLTLTEPVFYRLMLTSLGEKVVGDKTLYIKKLHNEAFRYFAIDDTGVFRYLTDNDGNFIDRRYLYRYPLATDTQWMALEEPFLMKKSIDEINAQQNSMPGLSQDTSLQMHYTIESVDETIKVPAGTFRQCVKVVGVGSCSFSSVGSFAKKMLVEVSHTDWYCPDVGLVKTERQESSGRVSLKPVHYVLQLHSLNP